MKDYKKILEDVVNIISSTEKSDIGFANICSYIGENCPELKESEGERIRKELLNAFQEAEGSLYMVLTPHRRESFISWLKKQGEQKLPIEKLPSEIKSIGESIGFTTQEECDKYNQMVTDLIMSDDDNGEQKPTDKVEPKSNIEKGKWYVCDTSRYTDFVVGKAYFCPKNGMLKPNENEIARYVAKDCFHLWTIQDAKDGDVLYSHEHNLLWIYKDKDTYYVAINLNYTHNISNGADMVIPSDVCPATKEQRDTLERAMTNAGYRWDKEKLKLEKI